MLLLSIMPVINSEIFKRQHNIPTDQSLSINQVSKLSGMPVRALNEVYRKGLGAYSTNPESVRPQVKSARQWAMGRLYSFVMKRKNTFGGADKHIADKYNL